MTRISSSTPTRTTQPLTETKQAEKTTEVTSSSVGQNTFDTGKSPSLLPSDTPSRELRPSELVRSSLSALKERFQPYKNDSSLTPAVYWNVNNPVDIEPGTERKVETSREYTTHTTTSPSDTRGEWTQPFSLTLGQWWKGGDGIGHGVAARKTGSVEGKYGSADGEAVAYSEVRTNVGMGGVVRTTGVEGGTWARARVVAAGAKLSGTVRSGKALVAGKELDVHVGATIQPFVGAEASGFVWGDVNVRKPAASVSVGGEVFAGARARNHVDFGLGDVFKLRLTSDLSAGAGASAGVDAGYKDGKVSLGANAGLTLGLGAKLGVEVDVDVKAVGQMAKHAVDRDADGKITLKDAGAGIQQGLEGAATGVEKGVDGIIAGLDANKDGKFTIEDAGMRLEAAGKGLQRGAEAVRDGVIAGVKATGAAIYNAADRDGDGSLGLDDVAAGVGQAGDALKAAGSAVLDAGQIVGRTGAALARGTAADLKDAGEWAGEKLQDAGIAAHQALDRNQDGQLGLDDAVVAGKEVASAIATGATVAAEGVVEAGKAVASGTVNAVKAAGEGISTAAKEVHRFADRDGDQKLTVWDAMAGLQETGDALASGARAVASGARSAASAIHRGADINNDGRVGLADISAGASHVATGIKSAASGVRRGTTTVLKAAGDQIKSAASSVKEGATNAYHRAGAALSRLSNFLGFSD